MAARAKTPRKKPASRPKVAKRAPAKSRGASADRKGKTAKPPAGSGDVVYSDVRKALRAGILERFRR